MFLEQGVTLENSENGTEMSPGPLGADPGRSRPVEMHWSRREIPSSAPTASNGRPKIRKTLQSDGPREYESQEDVHKPFLAQLSKAHDSKLDAFGPALDGDEVVGIK